MNAPELLVGITLSSFGAVVPTVAYVFLVRWLDRYEKEPTALLAGAFVWGAVPAIIVSLILEVVLRVPLAGFEGYPLSNIVQATTIAPIVEEAVKAVALLGLFLFFRREWDGTLDGVIYGALIGFGFGMTENFLFFLGSYSESGLSGLGTILLLRGGIFGFNHAFFTAITGAGLGYALTHPNGRPRWSVPLVALAAAIFFHALHNLGASIAAQVAAGFLISLFNIVVGVFLVGVIVIWALSQERRWIRDELKDEIGITITQGEYDLIVKNRSLIARRIGPLGCVGGQRTPLLNELSRLATELAFKKHRAKLDQNSEALARAIVQLRQRIAALRQAARSADTRPATFTHA
jgi:protease PrsW